jgi:lipopolysaccharide/colanic/teichoic acid biosynthesis glycosyltransferase
MIVKRFLDVVIALFLIAVLALPVMLPIWILIRLTSKGPAIYRQTRIGKDTKPFQIYKFRSMFVGADRMGYQTDDNDVRITPIGRWIRKTSLDELPQLFNVLRGDISMVGPRPDTPMQEAGYTPEDWKLRHRVRPGITGLAQVSGRSNLGTEERLFYDLEYARKHSLLLDINIIFKTFWIAMMGRGTN